MGKKEKLREAASKAVLDGARCWRVPALSIMGRSPLLWGLSVACSLGLVVCQLTTTETPVPATATSIAPTVGNNCSTVNTSLCAPCSPGTFYSNETASCSCCSSGSCADALDCKPCQEGHYQHKPGQLSCLPCPQGFYTNTTRSSTCRSCLPGSYTNETGASVCGACDKGYYSFHENSTFCLPCPEGSFCNTGSCSECPLCPDGQEALTEAAVNCSLCPPGMSKGPSEALCEVCVLGEFQPLPGKANCDQCPEDHYCPSPDVNPIQCPSDAFCPAGSSEPQYCMETFFRKAGDTCEFAPLTIVLLTISTIFGLLMIAMFIVKWKQGMGRGMDASLAPLLQTSRTRPKVYGVVCDAEPVYAGW